MGFKLGKALGIAAGFLAGGPAGGFAAASYFGQRSANKAAKNQMADQDRAYRQQADEARGEQIRMNQRLESERSKLNAGIARSNRSRSRGGIFGESGGAGNQNPLNPKLG